MRQQGQVQHERLKTLTVLEQMGQERHEHAYVNAHAHVQVQVQGQVQGQVEVDGQGQVEVDGQRQVEVDGQGQPEMLCKLRQQGQRREQK